MIDVLGFGGVGDCFIIILKLLEFRKTHPEFLYHHVENDKARLNSCSELLDRFNIPHKLIYVPDVKEWWKEHAEEYGVKFNMFAKGHIDVPFKPYHWEPFQDEGIAEPYSRNEPEHDWVIIQVNAGNVASAKSFRLRVLRKAFKIRDYESSRHILNRPILDYLKQTGLIEKRILWVGTDRSFKEPFGENRCGRMSFNETLDLIASCRTFVGLNSVLLYWALYNGVYCHLFMNYQGKTDQRIHELWKRHVVYLE